MFTSKAVGRKQRRALYNVAQVNAVRLNKGVVKCKAVNAEVASCTGSRPNMRNWS